VIHCWILLLSRAGPEARRAPAVCTQLPPPIEPAQATTLQIGVTEGRATDVTGCAAVAQMARSIRRLALPSRSSLAS
jgi:hypothetical protein